MLLFTLGIVLWILIPFYDKSKESGRRARAAHYFGLLAVFALALVWTIGTSSALSRTHGRKAKAERTTMNYPFWDIPYLGSGWVIGIIAIFHVMISQFAVGGGLYLPLAERKALREGRDATGSRSWSATRSFSSC